MKKPKEILMSNSEEVKRELDVSCSAFGFVDNGDFFLLDCWEENQALIYLIGLYQINEHDVDANDYVYLTTLEGIRFDLEFQPEIVDGFYKKLERLKRIWASGGHAKFNQPTYYIDWALKKGFEIPWLEYAIKNGFYNGETTSKLVESPRLDKDNSSNKALSTRTENNYLRLILTLANNIEGFNPKKYYEAAKLIIDATEIDISQQTIADYIKRAYEIESKKRD